MHLLAKVPRNVIFGHLHVRRSENLRCLVKFNDLSQIKEGRIVTATRSLLHIMRHNNDRVLLL